MNSLFETRNKEEDKQFSDQLQKHRERYYDYGLDNNPFPLGGNYPDAYLNYTFLSEDKKEQIIDFLSSTFIREEFNGMLVIGEYGSGKSHILHYIRKTVLTDPFFGKESLCFLIQNPSVSPTDILLSLLREVKFGVIQDLIFAPVADHLKSQYQDDAFEFLKTYSNLPTQGSFEGYKFSPDWYENIFSLSYREIVTRLKNEKIKIDNNKLQRLAREVLQNKLNIKVTSIIDDFVDLIVDDETKITHSWESFLSSRLMSKKGAITIEFYLQAFLELFKYADVRHVYLLVDELEDLRTQRLTQKGTVEYLATLRKMIQHNYKMFSFVLGCTRDAWNELYLLYPAISDRFPTKIDLAPTESEIKNIVLNYIKTARLEKYPAIDEWDPFTETAVEKVIEISGFVLRHVLTSLRTILDEAIKKKIKFPIESDFVVKQLSHIR